MLPMLAKSIAVSADLLKYCANPRFSATQKVDGLRLMIVTGNGEVRAQNRKGEPPAWKEIDARVLAAFATFKNVDAVFDGEYVDGHLYLFDLPTCPKNAVMPSTPYAKRREALESLGLSSMTAVSILPRACTQEAKVKLSLALIERGAEGLMFNHVDAAYSPGIRSTAVLKAKFIKDIDCVVLAKQRKGRDSIQVGVYDQGEMRVIGDCTLLAGDKLTIAVGDVVTVQYLYAVDPKAPRLYQPTRPRIRHDKSASECTIDQIQFTNKEVLK